MSKKYFKVSAARMRTLCGIEEARIFPVKAIENNMVGGRGFDTYVYLDTGDGWYKGAYLGKQEMFAARGVFVSESEYLAQCDADSMTATASYKTGHVYSDGKAQQAIGYSVGGQFVMSLPARLNGGRIPDLDECADILAGVSVKESDGMRNAAHDLGNLARALVLETVAALPGASVGAALTVTGDGTLNGVRYVMWNGRNSHSLAACATSPARLMAHWSGYVANCRADDVAEQKEIAREAARVDLSKPDAPLHVASVAVFPQEPNADIMERTRRALAERRTNTANLYGRMTERRAATVPAVVHEIEPEHVDAAPPPVADPGNPCDMCGACLHDGQTGMCDDCRQSAPAVLNFFHCPLCAHEWSGLWTANDTPEDCDNCGARNVTPCDSEPVAA